jgi:chorismate synthase
MQPQLLGHLVKVKGTQHAMQSNKGGLQLAPSFRHRNVGRRHLLVSAAGSTFGHMFRVTTFGESHGGAVGCIVDGVPPRMVISQVSLDTEEVEG